MPRRLVRHSFSDGGSPRSGEGGPSPILHEVLPGSEGWVEIEQLALAPGPVRLGLAGRCKWPSVPAG